MQIQKNLQNVETATNDLYKLLPLNENTIIKNTKYDLFTAETDSLNKLNLELCKIKDQIDDALNKVLCNRETQNLVQTADCVSLSSGAGLSLAMDVQVTESEEDGLQQENNQNFDFNKQGIFFKFIIL